MSRQSFAAALRSAARTLASDGMPAAVDRRVRERVATATSRPIQRKRWFIAGGLATAVAFAAAVVVVVGAGRGQRGDHELAGFALVDASADLRTDLLADGVLAVRAGSATIRSDEARMTIATRSAVRIRKEPKGVRVIAGAVDVSVARRRDGEPPARVDVSHGAILITGTRFRIEQRRDGGQVWLEQGAIVFIADDGRRREVRPGDSLSWPLPSEPAPREPLLPGAPEPAPREPLLPGAPARTPPHQPAPRDRGSFVPAPQPPSHRSVAPSAPPAPAAPSEAPAVAPASGAAEAATLFREIGELRARGQYREAAEAIERRLGQGGIRDATRELMSFELASILTYQLADTQRGCAALGRHAREYPRSPHAAAVERARADLGCRDDPGSPDRRDR